MHDGPGPEMYEEVYQEDRRPVPGVKAWLDKKSLIIYVALLSKPIGNSNSDYIFLSTCGISLSDLDMEVTYYTKNNFLVHSQ